MIKPMLLTEVEKRSDIKPNSILQVKINGIRGMLHIKNDKVVGIFGREGKPIMVLFPELRRLIFKGIKDAIIDGEIAVFKDGKSIFYGGVDHRNKTFTEEKEKLYPITFVAFDLLQLNSQPLVFRPYHERYDLLAANFPNCDNFQVISNYTNFDHLWQIVVEKDYEGIVVRNPKSVYELGKRSKENLKYKNYKEATVTVKSREQNEKGVKITGTTVINGVDISVDCQFANHDINDIKEGDQVKVLYLEVVGNKLIQPHKTGHQVKDDES